MGNNLRLLGNRGLGWLDEWNSGWLVGYLLACYCVLLYNLYKFSRIVLKSGQFFFACQVILDV